MNVCPEGLDRCLKTRYLKGSRLRYVARNCGNEAMFDRQCVDGSFEVSMCNESHCVAYREVSIGIGRLLS